MIKLNSKNHIFLQCIKLFCACSMLLLVSCSSSSTQEQNTENQPDVSSSSDELNGIETALAQGSSSDTTNDTNNSFSRRVSSMEFRRNRTGEILWLHFYLYDDAGKLLTEKVENQSEVLSDYNINYQYNVDGLLTAKSYVKEGEGTSYQLDTFEYDENDRVISMAVDLLNTGELVDYFYYSYDNRGLLAEYDYYAYYDNGAISFVGTYIYDENNVRTALTINTSDGAFASTDRFSYNEVGELEIRDSLSYQLFTFEDGPCSSAHLILDDDVFCR